jgi:uncharacterized coiled-coil protein SlyX
LDFIISAVESGSVVLSKHAIKVIYEEGVEAVAETIRQLYEMVEIEDERVQRMVCSATAAHLHRIEQLTTRINGLEEELASKVRQVHQLNLMVKEHNKELRQAREQTRQAQERHLAHLMKNSQNSSMPPSTDRRKRTRSLREKSGRKPGGQVGHPGSTLGWVEKPNLLRIHAPKACRFCGSSLDESEVTVSERRQVQDLPPQQVEVTALPGK